MAKLGKFLRTWRGGGRSGLMWWCLGCKEAHAITTLRDDGQAHPCWSYNGDKDSPTFSPSVLVTGGSDPNFRCHTFVRNGEIQYLTDCTHELAGQTVPMEPIPDDYGGGLEEI
jgi:hypothetical protein